MSLFLDDETYRSLLTNTSIHAELTRLREEVSAQKEWTRRAVDEASRLREQVRIIVTERDKAAVVMARMREGFVEAETTLVYLEGYGRGQDKIRNCLAKVREAMGTGSKPL